MNAAGFAPTHLIPETGLDARTGPSADAPRAGALDPWLPVLVIERDGPWARIVCENTWSAWVEGAALIERTASVHPGRRTTVVLWAGMFLGFAATAFPWLRSPSVAAWRVPVGVLWESGGLYRGGMTLGLLIAIVVAGVGGTAVATSSRFAARVGGGIVIGIAGIFLFRAFSSAGWGAFRLLGTGPFLLVLSGLALVVAHDTPE